ncbi:MAG: transposase [Geopsychrobacter sp.]|nr:transposase [Geopsychrobacter sp.]
MARKPRLHFPGAVYHVTLHGNGNQQVFLDDTDRTRFLLFIQEGIERFGHKVYAYCLHATYLQLVIEVVDVPLSRVMQQLGFRYTRWFNDWHRQAGHLFQGRYKAILIDPERYLLDLVREVHRQTGEQNLCLAGGVALNCVANGRILREGPFQQIWIQPAAGDAGGALGAAYLAYLALGGELPHKGDKDLMAGALLGPQYTETEMLAALVDSGLHFERVEPELLNQRLVAALEAGKVVGRFEGRMEFGPRALGNRSILADPRIADMQRRLNMKVKFREGFRPFAPAILQERCRDYFDLEAASPYMLLVSSIAAARLLKVGAEGSGLDKLRVLRSTIPAVTHIDRSARVQTVTTTGNPSFYALLKAFEAKTGCPLLVNTSFNVKDEPIVCCPEDAVRCFVKTEIDILVLGPFWVTKESL